MKTALKDYQMWRGSSKTSSRDWSGSVINVLQVMLKVADAEENRRKDEWLTWRSGCSLRDLLMGAKDRSCWREFTFTALHLSPVRLIFIPHPHTYKGTEHVHNRETKPFNFNNFKLWYILEVSYGRSSVVLSTPSMTITTVCWVVN